MMKLRIGAIIAIVAALTMVVFGLYVLGLFLLAFGVIGLIRSFRPGGYWQRGDR
jgi:hypothetical protein